MPHKRFLVFLILLAGTLAPIAVDEYAPSMPAIHGISHWIGVFYWEYRQYPVKPLSPENSTQKKSVEIFSYY